MNSLEPVTRGASPERTQGDVDETQQYLTFLLGDEAFAMDIRAVREIIQPSSMTIVPLMPEFVRGVINLRGSVVPVIDLSARFGRQRVQSGKRTSIIIYDARQQEDKQELGVMVDAVAEVVDIPDSAMEPAPQFGTTIAREFLRSIGKAGGRFIPVIDTDKTLSMDDMAQRVREWQRV